MNILKSFLRRLQIYIKANKIVTALLLALFAMFFAFVILPITAGYDIVVMQGYIVTIEQVYYAVCIVGVLITAFAVIVAIEIPSQVAEEQNKIALFKQRYEVYQIILKFLNLGTALKMALRSQKDYDKMINQSIPNADQYYDGLPKSIKWNTCRLMQIETEKSQSSADIILYIQQFKLISDMLSFLFTAEIGTSFHELLSAYSKFIWKLDSCSIEDVETMDAQFVKFHEESLVYIKSQLNLN